MNTLQFQKNLLSIQENMMNFALVLTTNREEARDLIQETSLKVLDNQDKFTENSNFKGWVLTVMRNIFINNYHKIVRTHTVIDRDTDLYNLNTASSSYEDSPYRNYQLQEITRVVENLREDLKVPFSMHLSGYKYEEIAACLKVSLSTSKSRVLHARLELQKHLKDFREI